MIYLKTLHVKWCKMLQKAYVLAKVGAGGGTLPIQTKTSQVLPEIWIFWPKLDKDLPHRSKRARKIRQTLPTFSKCFAIDCLQANTHFAGFLVWGVKGSTTAVPGGILVVSRHIRRAAGGGSMRYEGGLPLLLAMLARFMATDARRAARKLRTRMKSNE